jgi:autophagy-related protein 2
MLNDLWTPDVKAHQLSDVLSGVSPIRSLVNVGTGVADLVLLPLSSYQKDKRMMKGLHRGTSSFLRTTALESIKLGAKLATGTQVVLEKTEKMLGGRIGSRITAEAIPESGGASAEQISRYANQPVDVREGVQAAYKSFGKSLSIAGQTILALPMEIHERSGNEVIHFIRFTILMSTSTTEPGLQGAIRTVVRAVPIAMLQPMIGASEGVKDTLLGLRNTLDPVRREDDEQKYKSNRNVRKSV